MRQFNLVWASVVLAIYVFIHAEAVERFPPTVDKFKNQHVVSRADFARLGTDRARWDSFAKARGTGGKAMNSFVVGDYSRDILPSVRQGNKVRGGPPGNNLWRSKTPLRTVDIGRNKAGDINAFSINPKSRIQAGMQTFGSDPNRRATGGLIHYQGKTPKGTRQFNTPLNGGASKVIWKPRG